LGVNWHKWNRILHRDLGYFFFGMTVIYSLSGIALNHINDWNPSYIVTQEKVRWQSSNSESQVSKQDVLEFLRAQQEENNYKNHYHPGEDRLKIFLKNGSIELDLKTGAGIMEKIKRRPLFYEINFLHYNPKGLWTWFSDAFCVGLILVAISGLFILRGKTGIKGRGALFGGIGLVISLGFLLVYL
jgi:hypothetical protein